MDVDKRIQQLIDEEGMTREEAEFAVAIESGEIDGDLVEVDDGETDDE